MVSPLSGSLARTVGAAMAGLFLPATLTRATPGVGGDAFDPPAPTAASYPCRAIVEAYSDYFRKGGLVDAKDRKVLILANSLGVRPAADDKVTISGVTFAIIEVKTDPAEAVWECQGRM